MKRLVIGTAGHIDHGKTALVKALTGMDTDRLKEEKQRGISIELGFAPFTLPDGQRAAIVDVPGHERFIRHMLAGAFGVDMVLLVIAADEGIMPQTREHLDIIELLGVDKGIVVISKVDLVDEEWLMMVEEDIRQYLSKTILKDAPVIPVSAVSREGIPALINEIMQMAISVEEKPATGQARLPIDRVFTMSGFGTVITGTLWSGKLQIGDGLELMPVQKPVKIRTLQVHKEKVGTALAGQRVAVNLQGIEVSEIKRGYWLSSPGFLIPSYRVDTHLRLLHSSSRTLKNWNRIRFHLGTDEALGRIVLLDRDELIPGEEAYAQIVLEKPIVGYKGDRFVIRYYSPVSTIGGGIIIDATAPKQKRFREDVLEELVMKEEGSLYDVLLHELDSYAAMILSVDELAKKTAADPDQVKNEMAQLVEDEKVLELSGFGFISSAVLEQMREKVVERLEEYHHRYPLRPGYPREDMRSRLFSAMDNKAFNLVLKFWEDTGMLVSKSNQLMLVGFRPQPSDQETVWINKALDWMKRELFTPPALEEIKKELQIPDREFTEIITYLVNEGELIKVNQEVFFARQAIEQGKKVLGEYFQKEKELNLGTVRDLFSTSRKYALPLIEYYDRIRFTRRVGDMRVKI
ncbi:MAG TPA: selenocysteine-specific translation elongation factor [Syntrophomonadaceae bacterium]|nr:selenocysteine-specific translation elongation factor [Syntrophomonadaceae bacterium]